MSKFEEMSQAAADCRRRWEEYEHRCIQTVDKFVQEFVAYCDIPQKNVAFSPLQDERKPGTQYSLRDGMHFGDDGWWHLWLVLILKSRDRVLLELGFNEDNDGMLIRQGREGGVVSRLTFDDPHSLHAIFDDIIKHVVQLYSIKPQDGARSGKIGFAYSTVTDISDDVPLPPESTVSTSEELGKKAS